MPNRIALVRVERHHETTREDLANAAFDLCRAARGVEGVVEANFYWVLNDGVAIVVEAESDEALDTVVGGRGRSLAGAGFRPQDLGAVSTERWIHPKDAMFTYYSDRG